MAKLSKFFRVAVEGATVDGRTIERSWIQEMAANFNPATYGVRVNMEHIRGVTADGPFKAYGDVRAVKAEEIELELAGKKQKRLALFAQVEPTEELEAYNAKRQKIYTSVEISPNFAGTGKAGLVGLAVTDSPASLGTEVLQFAATDAGKKWIESRKQDPANYISEGLETDLVFEDAGAPTASPEYAGMFSAVTDFFKGLSASTKQPPVPAQEPATPPPANDNDARFSQILQGMEKMSEGMTALSAKVGADVAALNTRIAEVKTSIDTTDGNPGHKRPLAPGGGNFVMADC